MTAWQSYYNAVIESYTSPERVPHEVAASVSTKRLDEEDDAKLLFHSFSFMSDHFSKHHADERKCALPAAIQRPRQIPSGTSGPGHLNPCDRLWAQTRYSDLNNAFGLNNSAKLMEASYHSAPSSLITSLDANSAICQELGLQYLKVVCDLDSEVPSSLSQVLNRHGSKFPEHSNAKTANECINDLLERVDGLLDCPTIPIAAIMESIARGLAISLPLTLKVSTARLLVRLSRLRVHQGALADAVLLLDDIEGVVIANCAFYDIGVFFAVRAEALVSLAASAGDDEAAVLCDALKAVQLSVSAFDKGFATKQLKEAVTLAACICSKLELTGMCNFYSVKFQQINADSGMQERFFPLETGDLESVFNLGQPKIPSEVTNSPKAKDASVAPMSPAGRGRGLQTLIRWTANNRD